MCKGQVIVVEPRWIRVLVFLMRLMNLFKLEKANHIEQDIETESVNVVVSDFNSQDTIGFKGSASVVADNTLISTFPNIIPMSPSTNHDTTSLLSPTTNAKSKLVDVYDLEDTICLVSYANRKHNQKR
ncbi:unnamed protein product [Lactuca virosa]|uniref:Uncharacterized protein n=1 Tax=Lactuca virosa TaxID=75947 RepID=A0AAU9NMW8_9ASTR|nr:unnamed protein product [Lactuca virosa]